MAGRTPEEAVEAFLRPIQQAAGVLGTCKVTGTQRHRSPRTEEEHGWSLCAGDGVAVKSRTGALRFYAGMSWRLVEDDRDGYGPFRVTTTRYDYSLTDGDSELWALHWHPSGKSNVIYPHMHLGSRVLASGSVLSNKAHLPTGRMTFEGAVKWVIESGGRSPHEDWEARLALAEAPHLLYRSWTQDPKVERR